MDIFVTRKPVLLLLRNPTLFQIIQDRISHEMSNFLGYEKCLLIGVSLAIALPSPSAFFVQPGGSLA